MKGRVATTMADSKAFIGAKITQVEECDPPSQEVKDKVRQVICGYAAGSDHATEVADAELLMKMLGVHPSQDDEVEYMTGPHQLPNSATIGWS